MQPFKAFRIHQNEQDTQAGIEALSLDDLCAGEVVIRARYSSVNYKDAMAGTGKGRILRRSPLVGGIDVAGQVVECDDPRFKPGEAVLLNGSGLSEVHDGGYAEYVRVPADWVIPMPANLDAFQAMTIGTAGFTAALAVQRLEANYQKPENGPILVTGATGGVGSFAIDLLSQRGYEVAALTGKMADQDYLRALGAATVIDRHSLEMGTNPLESTQWGGAIDNAGDGILDWLTRTVHPWGNIVSIGLAAGTKLDTTVLPFILRGVALLGVTSANCPIAWRHKTWQRLADDLYPRHLDKLHAETVTLEELPEVFERILAGKIRGRVVVEIGG